MQKRRRDVMVACPFILPGHLLLGVVGFCDMTTLLPRHERGERWDSHAAPPSKLVLHRSWFISPPLNLTEDLTGKMLVHVNRNYITGFVFENSFQWYNFRSHASAFIVLYIMLVQFLAVLIYSKVPVRCTEQWSFDRGVVYFDKGCGVISRAHKHPGENR